MWPSIFCCRALLFFFGSGSTVRSAVRFWTSRVLCRALYRVLLDPPCTLPCALPCAFGPAVRSAVRSHRGFNTVRSIFSVKVWGSVLAWSSTAVTAGFVRRGHRDPVTTNNRRAHRDTHHRCTRMCKRSNLPYCSQVQSNLLKASTTNLTGPVATRDTRPLPPAA
jgi:hypothetical protein